MGSYLGPNWVTLLAILPCSGAVVLAKSRSKKQQCRLPGAPDLATEGFSWASSGHVSHDHPRTPATDLLESYDRRLLEMFRHRPPGIFILQLRLHSVKISHAYEKLTFPAVVRFGRAVFFRTG